MVENMEKTIEEKDEISDETPKFKGKFTAAIGRRKTSTAQVRLYKKGNGAIMVNDLKASEYFPAGLCAMIKQPLKLTGNLREVNISVIVKGGGKKGQADAVRHGISRVLLLINEEYRMALKSKGWLTRDSRKKERKKPGLRRARRAPQWAKR